jgi:hypothetical protein
MHFSTLAFIHKLYKTGFQKSLTNKTNPSFKEIKTNSESATKLAPVHTQKLLCLTWRQSCPCAPFHKDVWGSRSIAPCILNLSTRKVQLYALIALPWYPLAVRLYGPQCWSRRGGEGNKTCAPTGNQNLIVLAAISHNDNWATLAQTQKLW